MGVEGSISSHLTVISTPPVYLETKFTFPDPFDGNLNTFDPNCPAASNYATYGLGSWTLIKEIKMRGAIIGGTGFYEAGDLLRTETVKTPYGTVEVEVIRHQESEIAFLNRHGKGHSVPPS